MEASPPLVPQIRGMAAHQSAAISRWLTDCSANIAHYRKKTFWLRMKDTALLLPTLGLGAFIAYECIADNIPFVKVPSLLLLTLIVSQRFLNLSESAYLTSLLGKGYSSIVKEFDMTVNAIDLEEGGGRVVEREDIDRLMTRYRGLEAQSVMLPETISGSSATATYERIFAASQAANASANEDGDGDSESDSDSDEERRVRKRARSVRRRKKKAPRSFIPSFLRPGSDRERPRRRFFRRREQSGDEDDDVETAGAGPSRPQAPGNADLAALINSAIAASAKPQQPRKSEASSTF